MTSQQPSKRAKKSGVNVEKGQPAPPPKDPKPTPAAPTKNGRPTKLTPELQAAICEKIERGVYPEIAAIASGVHRATFYRWMQQGENARAKGYESTLRDFCDAIEASKAIAESKASQKLYTIATEDHDGRGSAGALIEYLRRTAPDRWAVKDMAKTGTDEGDGELVVKVRFVGGEASAEAEKGP
jgi:hypothetical protein